MAKTSSLRREEVANIIFRRGKAIVKCAEDNMSATAIGARFSISAKAVSAFLSQERQRRGLAAERPLAENRSVNSKLASAVAIISDSLIDDLAGAVNLLGNPAPARQRRVWETTPDEKPEIGDDNTPGYAAWELVHGAGLSVRDVQQKLGLRYPSEVFEMLAAHKKGLEDLRAQALNNNRAAVAGVS